MVAVVWDLEVKLQRILSVERQEDKLECVLWWKLSP